MSETSSPDAAAHDPEVAEEFAAAAGTDPTPDEIDQYRALSGEPPLGAGADAALPDPALDEVEDPDFEDPEVRDPEHASSERAAETPPHDDAERMEAALRIGGPLVTDDEDEAQQRREQPTEDGPGTSLN
jgi:hypothetical protein